MDIFLDDNHVYRNADGRKIPGVTSVINSVFRAYPTNEEREKIRQRCGGETPEFLQRLDRACKFGIATHRAIELHHADTLDHGTLSEPIKPYLAQWLRLLDVTGWKITFNELRLASERFGYAGTLDIIAASTRYIDTVVDIKTGGYDKTCALQTAAYKELYVEGKRIRKSKTIHRIVVQLDGSAGMPKIHEHTDATDFPCFLSCLSVYNYQLNNNLKRGEQWQHLIS